MEERIVNKAQELMFQTGVKHVTMDDLATQLGISKKTIYQYYKDKDSLVTAVVEKELNNHAQICNTSMLSAENAVHEIFLLLRVFLKSELPMRWLCRFFRNQPVRQQKVNRWCRNL